MTTTVSTKVRTTTITVYSRSGCVQCAATQRALTRAGLDFVTIDLDADPAALSHVKALGYRQAPVVEAGGRHWSGYRPDLLARLV